MRAFTIVCGERMSFPTSNMLWLLTLTKYWWHTINRKIYWIIYESLITKRSIRFCSNAFICLKLSRMIIRLCLEMQVVAGGCSFDFSFFNLIFLVNRYLPSQIIIERTKNPLKKLMRGKYIAKVKQTLYLRNHKVYKGTRGTVRHVVSPDRGLLFHYRGSCQIHNGRNICMDQEKVIDTSARKFAPEIWRKVDFVCKASFEDGICPSWIKCFRIENFCFIPSLGKIFHWRKQTSTYSSH